MFENRVLRGSGRRLEKTAKCGASPNITGDDHVTGDEMGRNVEGMGEMRNTYNILVGKPEGKRPLGRPRSRWEDNIRMDSTETG
jgi:hypothetical protein